MLGLLIRDKLNLEHLCGAPFVLSSCGHCYKEGEHPKLFHIILYYIILYYIISLYIILYIIYYTLYIYIYIYIYTCKTY